MQVPWAWVDPLVRPRQWKRDTRFNTWNVTSLSRSGSLTTVARELARSKLDLVGVQEVRLGKGGTVRTEDEKGNLVTECHSILSRWKNHFFQLLNVHGVNDFRLTEMHTAEPLLLELSAFEVKMATEELTRHKHSEILYSTFYTVYLQN